MERLRIANPKIMVQLHYESLDSEKNTLIRELGGLTPQSKCGGVKAKFHTYKRNFPQWNIT